MTYKFEFTPQEANIILSALGELPAKASLDLIMKIKDEAMLQEQESNTIKEVASEK